MQETNFTRSELSMVFLSLADFLLAPFVLVLIYYLGRITRNRHIDQQPEYKYYMPGLTVKLMGGIGVCLIYSLYYRGGDTVNYYHDGLIMLNLLYNKTGVFIDVMLNGINTHNIFSFDRKIGWPIYYRDPTTFIVVRLTCLLILVSLKSFVVTTILLAWISYAGVWRLYLVFTSEFPQLSKELSLAVLFIPSVFFWGSGLLKDTITFAALGFFTYSFYHLLIKRKKFLSHILPLTFSALIILSIKPYIFFALLPGSLIWLVGSLVDKFQGNFIKFFVTPSLLTIAILSAYFTLYSLSDQLGVYALDQVLERAVITQQDLKKDYYAGNSFDIGDFEPTIPSMLSKTPQAITATLFRPYIFEANNVVMLLSAIENTLMLLLTIYLFLKVSIIRVFKVMFNHNLLVFSLTFSMFFAFAVGLTTSNFGSLVRYKIPVMPFFVASLFIIRHYAQRSVIEGERKGKELKLNIRMPKMSVEQTTL